MCTHDSYVLNLRSVEVLVFHQKRVHSELLESSRCAWDSESGVSHLFAVSGGLFLVLPWNQKSWKRVTGQNLGTPSWFFLLCGEWNLNTNTFILKSFMGTKPSVPIKNSPTATFSTLLNTWCWRLSVLWIMFFYFPDNIKEMTQCNLPVFYLLPETKLAQTSDNDAVCRRWTMRVLVMFLQPCLYVETSASTLTMNTVWSLESNS